MSKFCVDGSVTNPKCYTINDYASKFASEEQILDTLLDVLKSTLPGNLREVNDCQNKPIVINEESIDLRPPLEAVRFHLTLNPLGDVPNYPEHKVHRTVEYNFELILTVGNENLDCVTWELIRFKNAVESLLISVELLIDGYDGVYLEPKGFNYFPIGEDKGAYFRQGAYRFSVTVTQYKIN